MRSPFAAFILPFLSVVAVGVTACAAQTAAGETSTTSPSPSTSTATAVVDAAPECSDLLASDAASSLLGSAATSDEPTALVHVPPAMADSVRAAGGVACTWASDASGALSLTVLPAEIVPDTVRNDWSDLSCIYVGDCGWGEEIEGAWVFATSHRTDDDLMAEIPDEEAARITSQVEQMMDAVRESEMLAGVAVADTVSGTGWASLECSELQGAAVAAAGLQDVTEGFPSDVFPEGPVWESLVDAGLVRWCGWYENGGAAIELYLQSGVGEPTEEQRAAAGAVPLEVDGFDTADSLEAASSASGVWFVGNSGENRLTIGGAESPVLEAIAAAVADAAEAQLNG